MVGGINIYLSLKSSSRVPSKEKKLAAPIPGRLSQVNSFLFKDLIPTFIYYKTFLEGFFWAKKEGYIPYKLEEDFFIRWRFMKWQRVVFTFLKRDDFSSRKYWRRFILSYVHLSSDINFQELKNYYQTPPSRTAIYYSIIMYVIYQGTRIHKEWIHNKICSRLLKLLNHYVKWPEH